MRLLRYLAYFDYFGERNRKFGSRAHRDLAIRNRNSFDFEEFHKKDRIVCKGNPDWTTTPKQQYFIFDSSKRKPNAPPRAAMIPEQPTHGIQFKINEIQKNFYSKCDLDSFPVTCLASLVACCCVALLAFGIACVPRNVYVNRINYLTTKSLNILEISHFSQSAYDFSKNFKLDGFTCKANCMRTSASRLAARESGMATSKIASNQIGFQWPKLAVLWCFPFIKIDQTENRISIFDIDIEFAVEIVTFSWWFARYFRLR